MINRWNGEGNRQFIKVSICIALQAVFSSYLKLKDHLASVNITVRGELGPVDAFLFSTW